MFANDIAERMFGYGTCQLIGKDLRTLVPESSHAGLNGMPGVADCNDADTCRAVQSEAVHRDGSKFTVELSKQSGGTAEATVVGLIIRKLQTHDQKPRERIATSSPPGDVGSHKGEVDFSSGELTLLKGLAAHADPVQALRRITEFVEQRSPGGKSALFCVSDNGKYLRLMAAPSLPAAHAAFLTPLPIGPAEEASGTAAYRRKSVYVEEIASDPLFSNYREGALSSGMSACLAVPIFGVDGVLLGTLAIYFLQPQKPDARQQGVFELATSVAALVIERLRAEQEMRITVERSEALLEHSAEALLLADADGIVLYRSPSARRLFGRRDEDVIGQSAFAFVHADQQEWVTSVFRAATKRREARTQAFRVIHENGDVRWIEVTISNQLEHPTLKAMILNCSDITDRVQTLNRLWQQEEQYRAIVEAVTDAILIIDLTGRIVTANKAACEMHGYTFEELIGRPATELVRPADHGKLETFAARAAAGEPYYAEAVHLKQDGGEVNVALHGTAFLMGGVPHLLAVVSNISEHKRMKQRLERGPHQQPGSPRGDSRARNKQRHDGHHAFRRDHQGANPG